MHNSFWEGLEITLRDTNSKWEEYAPSLFEVSVLSHDAFCGRKEGTIGWLAPSQDAAAMMHEKRQERDCTNRRRKGIREKKTLSTPYSGLRKTPLSA